MLTQQRKNKEKEKDIVYLKLPYINDDVDKNIRRTFSREGLHLRIVHRTRTLRRELSAPRPFPECKLKNCPIMDSHKCHTRHTVYKLTCKKCNQSYIGSTIRPLHVRVLEHMSSASSSVFKHNAKCNNNKEFDINIIGRSNNDEADLRLMEAILIKEQKPVINSRQEKEELQEFLFL